MGLLSLGTPLDWQDTKKHADYIRTHGIKQLIASLERHAGRRNDPPLWGDELEYMVVNLSQDRATLSLRQNEILDTLIAAKERGELDKDGVSYHQEYGRFMLEATPSGPYGPELSDLLTVEDNMLARRRVAKDNMQPSEYPLTITSFPRLGVPGFINEASSQESHTANTPGGPAARSLFLPDSIINTHVRFPTLTANIRERRGSKVAINIPLFHDENTPWPFHDPTIEWDRNLWPEDANAREGAAKDNHIYMDAMGFGMGCCCLQMTQQAADITQARHLYDQLAPLTPIMSAISASSPFHRGMISDQDMRWNIVSASVDDRTPQERKDIQKSRYDSISSYIGTHPELTKNAQFYNDVPLEQNEKIAEQLRAAGLDDMDEMLVQHFAHLFIRDPLVIFEEKLKQNDSESMDHFENIQSTNWQTMRFKPPPTASDSFGWRVEFRSLDVQITDFENAALCVFINLVSRVIIHCDLLLYQPLSQVDENLRRAHKRDAVVTEKFYWRTTEGKFREATTNEIFNGAHDIKGLVPLVKEYLAWQNISSPRFDQYIKLVSERASGKTRSAARWMRDFVDTHPDYKHDSVLPEKVQHDLLVAITQLSAGEKWDTLGKSMLGGFSAVTSELAAPAQQNGSITDPKCRCSKNSINDAVATPA